MLAGPRLQCRITDDFYDMAARMGHVGNSVSHDHLISRSSGDRCLALWVGGNMVAQSSEGALYGTGNDGAHFAHLCCLQCQLSRGLQIDPSLFQPQGHVLARAIERSGVSLPSEASLGGVETPPGGGRGFRARNACSNGYGP